MLVSSTFGIVPRSMQANILKRIFSQQIEQIYAQAVNAIFGVIGVSLVSVFLFWTPQLADPLILWFTCLLGLSLIRFLLVRAYRKAAKTEIQPTLWARRYLLLELAMGLSWASLGLVLYQSTEIDLVLMMLILGSMATGALPMLSAVLSIYLAYLLSLGLGTVMILLTRDTGDTDFLALFTVIYILALWLAARANNLRNSHTLRLSEENQDLVNSLQQQIIQTSEAEARYRTLSDATNEGVLLHEQSRILDANQRATEMLGYKLDELKSLPLTQIFDESSKAQMDLLLSHDSATDYEIYGLCKDGSKLPMEVNKRRLSLQLRNIDVITLHDITSLKQITEIKDQFISTVSHELRTPLTSIHATLSLILGGIGGDISEKNTELLSLAYKNSERLNTLINDLLDVQKLDEGKLTMKLEKVDIMELVQQSIDLNQAFVEKFKCRLLLKSSQTNALVMADRARLLQVLTNLISNAAKFSSPASDIVLTVSRQEDLVRVSVFNQGSGIPEEFQERIFQRFSQADASSTRSHNGSGLGLYISRKIMHDMGGEIEFISKPDKGTTFYISMNAIAH